MIDPIILAQFIADAYKAIDPKTGFIDIKRLQK
jgi:hypothetical protein